MEMERVVRFRQDLERVSWSATSMTAPYIKVSTIQVDISYLDTVSYVEENSSQNTSGARMKDLTDFQLTVKV